ncbi:GNAT family N-acetyltransferase [Providencia rustigianii]|uniref:GNAT family N-acetyltransferase n=1 Tax=Providencia rustigianii TaxID=158850 RepID=UPI0038B3559D
METANSQIIYKVNHSISVDDFLNLINQSPLDTLVPSDNLALLDSMLNNADLLISAWVDEQLVGFARGITDFSFCCYISEIAVDTEYLHQGVGKHLLRLTAEELPQSARLFFAPPPTHKTPTPS